MGDICVYSNYQLHTCGLRARVSENYLKGITTLECISIPRWGRNRLRLIWDATHTIVHAYWSAVRLVRSLFMHLSVEFWRKWLKWHDNNLATVAKASVLFFCKCSSFPQTFFNGSFFLYKLSPFPPASLIYSLPTFWFTIPRYSHISLCSVLASVKHYRCLILVSFV